MPKFSDSSIKKLATCDSRLQMIAKEAIKIMDFSVIDGHRDNATQDELFRKGFSKKRGGESRHNSYPSMAMDLAPYPIDFSDRERFFFLMGIIKATAHKLGIRIRLGCDFNGNGDLHDDGFVDLPHVELIDE